jgi:hypothetical protein
MRMMLMLLRPDQLRIVAVARASETEEKKKAATAAGRDSDGPTGAAATTTTTRRSWWGRKDGWADGADRLSVASIPTLHSRFGPSLWIDTDPTSSQFRTTQ